MTYELYHPLPMTFVTVCYLPMSYTYDDVNYRFCSQIDSIVRVASNAMFLLDYRLLGCWSSKAWLFFRLSSHI
jgi:hypothetical protein